MTFKYKYFEQGCDKTIQLYVDLLCKMAKKIDEYLERHAGRDDHPYFPPEVAVPERFEDFMRRALIKKSVVRVMTNDDPVGGYAPLIAEPGYCLHYGEMIPLQPLEISMWNQQKTIHWFLDIRWTHPGGPIVGWGRPTGRIYMGLMRSIYFFGRREDDSYYIKDGASGGGSRTWLVDIVSDDKSRAEEREAEKASLEQKTAPSSAPATNPTNGGSSNA